MPAFSELETALEILTAASGALVPIATIVRPIIKSGTRSRRAIETQLSTKNQRPLQAE